ncbi:MAG: acyl-CoA dehydrogenase family protein [Anaerolineales bacterium]
MYSFEPSEEQAMLVEAARRYAENDLRPAAHEADEEGELPTSLIEKGWQLGVLQASVPEEFGGFGERSAVSGALAAEELAYGDLSAAIAVMTPSSFVVPLLIGGDDEQKTTWLPPVVEGDWRPYTAALIEPQFDFSPLNLRTAATADGDGFLLTGEKTYVPFADQAPAILVFANLADEPAAFIVPADADGLTIGERRKLLGLGAVPLHDVTLEEVRVSADSRVGTDGSVVAEMIASSQVAVAALAVGLSRAAHEYSLEYAKERDAFGEPIAHKQAIAFMVAEMATEIEAIRLMVWDAAWKLDAGEDASRAAYLAQVGAADMAMMVTDRAVQILGGHGYIREHPVERWMRNGRGIPVFTGLAMV